jgi:hypothetical protein
MVRAQLCQHLCRPAGGGFSGGTIASMLNVLDEAQQDPCVRPRISIPG